MRMRKLCRSPISHDDVVDYFYYYYYHYINILVVPRCQYTQRTWRSTKFRDLSALHTSAIQQLLLNDERLCAVNSHNHKQPQHLIAGHQRVHPFTQDNEPTTTGIDDFAKSFN